MKDGRGLIWRTSDLTVLSMKITVCEDVMCDLVDRCVQEMGTCVPNWAVSHPIMVQSKLLSQHLPGGT